MPIMLFAVLIAVVLELISPLTIATISSLSLLLLLGGSMILLLMGLFNGLIVQPLASLERKLIPNLLEVVSQDRAFYWKKVGLYLFVFLSYASAILILENPDYQKWTFLVWLILFGTALDLFHSMWESVTRFLNPTSMVNDISAAAIKAVQQNEDQTLWKHLDGLSEIGLSAIDQSKIALSSQTLQAFSPIIHAFFDSSKSISRFNRDDQVREATGRDEANYTIFYLLQRLELLNDKALQQRLESVCRQMILLMGRIIVYSAKYDLTMVSFPTHFLSKFGLKAQQHHFNEVAELTTSTLLEIAKTITTEVDVTYAQLQEPFRAILSGLDSLAKNAFKKEKQTSIPSLIHSFEELKNLLKTDKMQNHIDTPVIEREIQRVIDEFKVLEDVLRGRPSSRNTNDFIQEDLPL